MRVNLSLRKYLFFVLTINSVPVSLLVQLKVVHYAHLQPGLINCDCHCKSFSTVKQDRALVSVAASADVSAQHKHIC